MSELAVQEATALLERVVVGGDLSKLTSADRILYYREVCASVGLNPLTRPLEYISLSGRLVLYARKEATDQLRTLKVVSVTKLEREYHPDGLYTVTAYATDSKGRTDAAIGAVDTRTLKGDALANAVMKAETKAKRRVTLSLCGLGLLDETEVDSTPGTLTSVTETEVSEVQVVTPVVTETPADMESEERAALIQKIGTMTPARIKVLKQRLLGDAEADLSKVDVSALKQLADQADAR